MAVTTLAQVELRETTPCAWTVKSRHSSPQNLKRKLWPVVGASAGGRGKASSGPSAPWSRESSPRKAPTNCDAQEGHSREGITTTMRRDQPQRAAAARSATPLLAPRMWSVHWIGLQRALGRKTSRSSSPPLATPRHCAKEAICCKKADQMAAKCGETTRMAFCFVPARPAGATRDRQHCKESGHH